MDNGQGQGPGQVLVMVLASLASLGMAVWAQMPPWQRQMVILRCRSVLRDAAGRLVAVAPLPVSRLDGRCPIAARCPLCLGPCLRYRMGSAGGRGKAQPPCGASASTMPSCRSNWRT